MNQYLIAAYATKNSPYEKILKDNLFKSLTNSTLPFHIEYLESQGNWYRNTALKPKFVLDIFKRFEKDVVLLDADSTIEQYPKLFDEIPAEYDMAAHTLSWRTWYGYDSDQTELLSGTLYLRNNDKVRALCSEWYKIAIQGDVWEQKVLEQLIPHYNVKVYPLPIEYCFIKTRPGGLPPLVKCEPVIVHHQASREHKRSVK